jgi:hypothetical protein
MRIKLVPKVVVGCRIVAVAADLVDLVEVEAGFSNQLGLTDRTDLRIYKVELLVKVFVMNYPKVKVLVKKGFKAKVLVKRFKVKVLVKHPVKNIFKGLNTLHRQFPNRLNLSDMIAFPEPILLNPN